MAIASLQEALVVSKQTSDALRVRLSEDVSGVRPHPAYEALLPPTYNNLQFIRNCNSSNNTNNINNTNRLSINANTLLANSNTNNANNNSNVTHTCVTMPEALASSPILRAVSVSASQIVPVTSSPCLSTQLLVPSSTLSSVPSINTTKNVSLISSQVTTPSIVFSQSSLSNQNKTSSCQHNASTSTTQSTNGYSKCLDPPIPITPNNVSLAASVIPTNNIPLSSSSVLVGKTKSAERAVSANSATCNNVNGYSSNVTRTNDFAFKSQSSNIKSNDVSSKPPNNLLDSGIDDTLFPTITTDTSSYIRNHGLESLLPDISQLNAKSDILLRRNSIDKISNTNNIINSNNTPQSLTSTAKYFNASDTSTLNDCNLINCTSNSNNSASCATQTTLVNEFIPSVVKHSSEINDLHCATNGINITAMTSHSPPAQQTMHPNGIPVNGDTPGSPLLQSPNFSLGVPASPHLINNNVFPYRVPPADFPSIPSVLPLHNYNVPGNNYNIPPINYSNNIFNNGLQSPTYLGPSFYGNDNYRFVQYNNSSNNNRLAYDNVNGHNFGAISPPPPPPLSPAMYRNPPNGGYPSPYYPTPQFTYTSLPMVDPEMPPGACSNGHMSALIAQERMFPGSVPIAQFQRKPRDYVIPGRSNKSKQGQIMDV